MDMHASILSIRETERIAALSDYGILDTAREPSFDAIVVAAAQLCSTPIAAITFIDAGRQWSKASVGIEALNMPADASICALAIRQKGILIMRDISCDPRLVNLAGVFTAPMPRFYAGVPLETAEGHAIGTLCVLDNEARDLTQQQAAALQALARHVMAELELRRAFLAECEARLKAERLLAEKDELIARNDVLMREVDHRVKNSLQLVASMLSLQARGLTDDSGSKALNDAQQRVAGIAAVHEQLYRASEIDAVDLRGFLQGLCASLAMNRPDCIRAVNVKSDSVEVSSKRAMKVGLVVTELVANAFKHAFPRGQHGDINVVLTATEDALTLAVSDDGVGLPLGFCPREKKGLGLQLVQSVLSEFGGTLNVSSENGARFTILLPRHNSPSDAKYI